MSVPALLQDLLLQTPAAWASRAALTPAPGAAALSYGELAEQVERARGAFANLGLPRGARVAVYLEKRLETVVACFGACAAGLVMVPINPGLKAAQVRQVLEDAQPLVWITTDTRLQACSMALDDAWWRDAARCSLQHLVLAGVAQGEDCAGSPAPLGSQSVEVMGWDAFMALPARRSPLTLDSDLAALLYTSGSTGHPKGVMLSHRNLVVGARSVVQYLNNGEDDVLLAVLPLSFDAGFSQLTTAFTAGARAVLLNHLLPQDVVKALAQERVTGLTAVPPLYHQLLQTAWPQGLGEHLRYFASTGGAMPARTLAALRERLPRSAPYIMYGLTEAFRSTYLPPQEVDRKPGSMGRAIPNVEVLVLHPDGRECEAGEEGELVHRGPLVGLGYWRDPQRTAERFRPLPVGLAGRGSGHVLPEMVVYSGDRVRRDEEGFLYHLGRLDEQIKTSGYRVSPTEVEEVMLRHPSVAECVVFGVPDEALGQRLAAAICSTVSAPSAVPAGDGDSQRTWVAHARQHLPAHMVPSQWHAMGPLPRNPNGKIDRPRVVALALGSQTAEGDGVQGRAGEPGAALTQRSGSCA